MRNYLKVSLLFLFFATTGFSQQLNYCRYNPVKCKTTIDFYKTNKSAFESIALNNGYDPVFLFSIVAPEVSRFSHFEEAWQTTSMEVLYCELGMSYANFSLGYFQMKPSWLENLEKEARNFNITYEFQEILKYNQPDNIKEVRKERLERLKSIKWQYRYLCLFCRVIEMKFPNQRFETVYDKLKFYATAFNFTFRTTSSEILKWQKIPYFPHGRRGSDYVYCNVSLDIYLKLNDY